MGKTKLLTSWILLILYVYDSNGDEGYFWHITDIHYDFTYNDRQLSCNTDNRPINPGEFGDFWCDSPWLLVDASVRGMANIKQGVDFLLWTGDTILHTSDDNLNHTIIADILSDCTDVLKTLFPGKPVYASFGNNDYWPSDQFPPVNNLMYNETLDKWRGWINDVSQDENFRKGGYYTVKTSHGLRIIALNTNLYYKSNKDVDNVTDPAQQFQWLNTTLNAALTSQEKVLITAHIPPGVHTPRGFLSMYPEYNDKLVAILQLYADIIVGMHFGHDHADGFKILSNTNGVPTAPIFIAPSVTPWRYKIPTETGLTHNPGIRLVKYDRQTGVHLEIDQYYLDLQKANRDGVATWQLEYNTSVEYGLTALNGAQLHKLAEKMKNPSVSEFKNYWKFYTVSPPADLDELCDETCHASVVCGFTQFKMDEFTRCKTGMISNAPLIPRVSYLLFVFCTICWYFLKFTP